MKMMSPTLSKTHDRMWKKYVPSEGEADTEFGEELRLAHIIVNRYDNDGYFAYFPFENELIDYAVEALRECENPALAEIASDIRDLMEGYLDEDDYTYRSGDRDWDSVPNSPDPYTVEDYDALMTEMWEELERMCARKARDPAYLDTPRFTKQKTQYNLKPSRAPAKKKPSPPKTAKKTSKKMAAKKPARVGTAKKGVRK